MYWLIEAGGIFFVLWMIVTCIQTHSRRAVEAKEREMIVLYAKEMYDKHGILPNDKAIRAIIHRDLWGE